MHYLISSEGVNKIPSYVSKDYKQEYLFLRGINIECFRFLNRLGLCFRSDVLFVIKKSLLLKTFLQKFIRYQELGYLKDLSKFVFKHSDLRYIAELYDILECESEYEDKLEEFEEFFSIFKKFYFKLNKYDITYNEWLFDLGKIGFGDSDEEFDYSDVDEAIDETGNENYDVVIDIESDSESESD